MLTIYRIETGYKIFDSSIISMYTQEHKNRFIKLLFWFLIVNILQH